MNRVVSRWSEMPSIAPSKSTTASCLARVPYLNAAPFFRGLRVSDWYELIDCVPRRLGERAALGEISAGLMPLVDYFRQQEMFERIGSFGIAVRGRAESVLLFSRKPIRQLEGGIIAVTEETSTSAILLRLVLEQRYRLTPSEYVRGHHSDADALLLIGDEALRVRQTNSRYPFETDLSFEWWLWQHLPTVFAVWVIRKDAAPEEKRQLQLALSGTLGRNLSQFERIAQEASPALGVPVPELTRYLSRFIYRLGHQEEEAITQLKALVDEYHLL